MRTQEIERIRKQLERTYSGDAWHGPSLRKVLEDIDPETASVRPIAGAHSAAELAAHVLAWRHETLRRLEGNGGDAPVEGDWPEPAPWRELLAKLDRALRHFAIATLLVLAGAALAGRLALAPWLAWKLALVAGAIACGLGIRYALIAFFRDWSEATAASGPAGERRIRAGYWRATAVLMLLWIFLAAITVVSVLRPGCAARFRRDTGAVAHYALRRCGTAPSPATTRTV